MTYKLSPSTLNLLEECPRCFWLQIVKKESRPSGAFPSLPSGVDKILKEHFDRFMKRSKLPPELEKEGLGGCRLFDNEELLERWRTNWEGISYTDKESGIVLRGAIDNLLQKGDKLIVLDFKTRGFALKEDTHHHYQDQMNCYNFLLRKNGYDTEDYTYLLFYMPERISEKGEFLFETKLVKMETNVKHAETLFNKAINILQDAMPESNQRCDYCNWNRNSFK